MDFDFASVDTKTLSEKGVPVTIRRLDGQPLLDRDGKEVQITLLGPDSAKYRALTRENVRKRLERRAQGAVPLTVEEVDEVENDSIEILAVCTASWSGVNTPQGEPIDCTVDNARKLYLNYPVIREQVDAFIGNRANFIQASSKR
jgi:hypothetical protein